MTGERAAPRLEILVITDDESLVARLAAALGRGYAVAVASCIDEELDPYHALVVADLRCVSFADVRARHPGSAVIVVSSSAVEVMDALTRGAWDFLPPAADAREMRGVARRGAAYVRIAVEADALSRNGARADARRFTELVGDVRRLTGTLRRERRRLTARAGQRGS